jgi:hypothetical protein
MIQQPKSFLGQILNLTTIPFSFIFKHARKIYSPPKKKSIKKQNVLSRTTCTRKKEGVGKVGETTLNNVHSTECKEEERGENSKTLIDSTSQLITRREQ